MADIKNRINKTFVKSGKMGQAVFGRRNKASIGMDSLQPELRNPLLNIENYFFPFSRKELNSWLNYYSIVHPVVSNALDLHSTLPWSSFKFEGIDDEDVLSYYQDVADDLKLFEMFMDITKHYFQYGEALPYAHWDNRIDCFDYIQLLMPDDVIIDSVNPLDVRFRVDVKNMTEMIFLNSFLNNFNAFEICFSTAFTEILNLSAISLFDKPLKRLSTKTSAHFTGRCFITFPIRSLTSNSNMLFSELIKNCNSSFFNIKL